MQPAETPNWGGALQSMPDPYASPVDGRVAQIRARAEAATPGPWGLFMDNGGEWTVDRVSIDDDDLGMEIAVGSSDLVDGEFIAAARSDIPYLLDQLAEARRQLAEATGDEHHTMDELYEYRMLYNAHASHGWLAAGIPVVKSWRHSDGELCFGGGWFIVSAQLPSGQVTNHYAAEHWELFSVPEVELPPEYDGHTPTEAANRLAAALGVQQ